MEATTTTARVPVLALQEESKPKKKICCSCPDTKKERDSCMVLHGEDLCLQFIEAHKVCLRKEGFQVD